MMMILILSPAKTLDLSPLTHAQSQHTFTSPCCSLVNTRDVASAMKKHAKKGGSAFSKLLGISANLASTAIQYWDDFRIDSPSDEIIGSKPAIFSFSGAAYQGLSINDGICENADAVNYLQSNLRIIDPLYGTLKPLDLMQPYRLEMATKNIFDVKEDKPKTLASFWQESVTSSICGDLLSAENNEKVVVNLASDEYAAAVNEAAFPSGTKYIKIVFQNQGRVIAVHAKKARGMMVRYLAENGIENVEGMKGFNSEGYSLIEEQSSDLRLVFDRDKQSSKPKKKAAVKRSKAAKETTMRVSKKTRSKAK